MNEKLLMQIGLVDQVTKPLRGVTKDMQSSMDLGRRGVRNVATGAAGLVATGLAIQNALMPAIEIDRKIGEVKSLGVVQQDLDKLEKTALSFSAQYGKSATEFIGASYDIKSAMGNINGDQLADITNSSAVLAAATKADTATITNYMGTMYGVFKNHADEMGVGIWSKTVAGMTAQSVEMFKTTGSGMSSAFTSVGADATSAGIAMEEQMAILGTLQSTMSGSEAGTKYRAFIGGVSKAQDKLNLSFTDSQGEMLPMLDILDKLKGKYGDTLDVAESAELKEAFGTKEASAMIKLLMADTDGLAASIETLGNVQGMAKAEEMAAAMTDQWQRLESVWFAVRASVFGAVLPSINAVIGSMADGMMVIVGWVDEFPILGQILGWVALAGLSLGGVVAALSLSMGIAQMMSAGWGVTMGVLKAIMLVTRVATLGLTSAVWTFGAALLATPIGWVIGIVALLVGAIAAAIYWWDDLKATFGDSTIFKMLGNVIEWIVDKLNMIPGIDIEFNASSMPDLDAATAAQTVERTAPKEITAAAIASDSAMMPTSDSTELFAYKNAQNIAKPSPSAISQLTTNNNQQGGKVNSYGDVYITAPNGMTPDQLAEWDELNAG
ncbi:phage tail tape measure protein [Vibrio sp. DW001]|uniref:phage tail tape measure protein n=1 Tax=Vibrio sp. DW001 TaxID=2912315 RepID=UPI0023B038AF|nr:phage tail tape measure protein [Vibrio sp. DW001]WED29048.1 phage tail tape measure protein [Vibrio sp. DW001]